MAYLSGGRAVERRQDFINPLNQTAKSHTQCLGVGRVCNQCEKKHLQNPNLCKTKGMQVNYHYMSYILHELLNAHLIPTGPPGTSYNSEITTNDKCISTIFTADYIYCRQGVSITDVMEKKIFS